MKHVYLTNCCFFYITLDYKILINSINRKTYFLYIIVLFVLQLFFLDLQIFSLLHVFIYFAISINSLAFVHILCNKVNHAFSISSARANILFGPWVELSMPLAIDTYLIDCTVITWKSISVLLETIDIFIA